MNWDARLESTCALRNIYKDGVRLTQDYKDKYAVLEFNRYPNDINKKINDLRYYKGMIEYHRNRCFKARIELILRNKPITLRKPNETGLNNYYTYI